MVTRMPTATIGIATAKWRQRLATKDIRDGPRRCHDGGRAGDYSWRLETDEYEGLETPSRNTTVNVFG